MPQTGTARSRRSPRGESPLPARIAAFDPVGEIAVRDRRGRPAAERGAERAGDSRAVDRAIDSRAAERAAMAEQFAARFGLDELGPSADVLADRYDIRFAPAAADSGLLAGRRTVTITGRGADRAVPPAERSLGRPARSGRRSGRRGSPMDALRTDRVAMWAVALALLLAFVAATTAHAAVLHAVASLPGR